jgi:hypothetical protein
MRISADKLDYMFSVAKVEKEVMYTALRVMGAKELKAPLRKEWSTENPTRNFCYVIAEMVLNYCAPGGSAYSLPIQGDQAKHYFVRTYTGTLLDLAAEQFPEYSVVHYEDAKKTHFQFPSPSRRARRLWELMLPEVMMV